MEKFGGGETVNTTTSNTTNQNSDAEPIRLLVIIEPREGDQPALTQALMWAQTLQSKGFIVEITTLMVVYSYATEINTMLTGTVLHNLRRQLTDDSEKWLTRTVADFVERFSNEHQPTEKGTLESSTLNITPSIKVVWQKKLHHAVSSFFKEQESKQLPHYHFLLKSLNKHPIYKRLFMQIEEWQVVRVSQIPVLLVREPRQPDNLTWLTAVDPHNPQHTSLNDLTLDAVSKGIKQLGGQLKLIHAFPSLSEQITPLLSTYGAGEYMVGAHVEEDEKRLNRFLESHHLSRDILHSQQGDIGKVVNEFAHSLENPLVVIGSRAHLGLADRMVGHAAEHIIEHSEHNTLVIKEQNSQHEPDCS